MSAEVAIAWDGATGAGDLRVVGLGLGELEAAPPLVTAVYVSLFTDARARPDDGLAAGEDPRGWWAELLEDQPIGSRLWLLRRAKHLPDTLARARDMIRDALAWLIRDGIAARVEVDAEWQGASRIAATVTIHRADGARDTVTAAWAWQGT